MMKTNTILHGDSFEELSKFPKNSVDCVVTSPPYWGQRDYGVAGQVGVEEKARSFVEKMGRLAEELSRVVSDTGSFWLNIADTYNGCSIIRQQNMSEHPRKGDEQYEKQLAENRDVSGVKRRSSSQFGLPRQARMHIPARVAMSIEDEGWFNRDEVIWQKKSPKPEGRVSSRLYQSHEKIYRFVQSENATFTPDAISPSFDTWEIATGGVDHPAPYSTELPRRCIELTTGERDVVLDPFVGAGTTCVAAQELDRQFVGIDICGEFVSQSRERLGL